MATPNSPKPVPSSPAVKPERYSGKSGVPFKVGSDALPLGLEAQCRVAIDSFNEGDQNDLIIKLSPHVVKKATVAALLLREMAKYANTDLSGSVAFDPDGFYYITIPGFASASTLLEPLLLQSMT